MRVCGTIDHFRDRSTHAGILESVEKRKPAPIAALLESPQEQYQALAHESLDHADTAFGVFPGFIENHLEELAHPRCVREIDDDRVLDEIEEVCRLSVVGLDTSAGNHKIGITGGGTNENLASGDPESFDQIVITARPLQNMSPFHES